MVNNDAITALDEAKKQLIQETEDILHPKINENNEASSKEDINKEDISPQEVATDENTEPTQEQQEGGNPQSSEEMGDFDTVNTGVSDAYTGLLKRKEPIATKNKSSHWPSPPERKKSNVKVAGGKDIMEVFWNEMWQLVDDIVDWTVDRTLDFITFALYPSAPKSKDEKKVENADVFAAGQAVLENTEKTIDTKLKMASFAHAEIKNNLQKVMNGETPEWKISQTEPPFFQQLVQINKKALNDPNSDEAKKLERFNNIPNILEQMGANAKKITKIAINWSTLEESLHPNTKAEAIKAAKETFKNDKTKLKEEMEKINEIYANPQKHQEMIEKSITGKMEERTLMLYENINKIRETHHGDSEKLKTTLAEYLGGISSSLKNATDVIYDQMYNMQKTGRKNKDNAVKSLNTLTSAVTEFTLADTPISEVKKAQNQNNGKDINVKDWSKEDVQGIFKKVIDKGR